MQPHLRSFLSTACLTVLLFAAVPTHAATNVSGNITTNTTWTAAGGPYILSGDVSVGGSASPTLTIEAGVIVKANANAHLLINVHGKGALVTRGTAQAPVVLTANGPATPGYWQGVRFGTIAGGPASSLTHTTIEYAAGAAITVEGGSPSITRSTIRHNLGAGIHTTGGDATLTGIAFLSNTGPAISAHPNTQLSGMTGLAAAGNGTDAVEYRGGDMTVSRTWKTCALPYVVASSIHVGGTSAPILTIEPGNTIRFNRSSQIAVNERDKGGLAANGTAAAPILFTSNTDTPAPGSWWGLSFGEAAGNTPSSVSHAIIEYAGDPVVQRGGVTVYDGSPVFTNVLIHHCAFAGAALHGGSASFLDSHITANDGPGIYAVNAVGLTLTDTAFTNNEGGRLQQLPKQPSRRLHRAQDRRPLAGRYAGRWPAPASRRWTGRRAAGAPY